MRKRTLSLMLTVLFLGGLAACGENSSILDPDSGVPQSELDIMVDQDVTDAILIDAVASLDALLGDPVSMGYPETGTLFAPPDEETIAQARALIEQARQKWELARQAWFRGDTELAAELAQEARMLVAEALILVHGEEAYTQLLARVDQLITWLEQRGDELAAELLGRIQELRAEAEALKDSDLQAATATLIAALQIGHRERMHQRRQEMAQHARLSVFMAQSAVQLAAQIAGDDATERQIHALRHARHVLVHAIQALEAGRYRIAFALAREVTNLSLVVVMLEPGIELNRVAAMVELSNRAIAAAEEALASTDAGSFPARLLEHAKALQAKGLEFVDTRPRVAINLLWHASVTAYGVIRMVS